MTVVFYIAGAVALISTLLVVTRHNTIHALLYLVVSLLAVAVVFYTLGAPFVAALEVIVYAGAIIVLFLFTVMLLNVGREAEGDEAHRLRPASFIGPGLLAAVLLVELAVAIASGPSAQVGLLVELAVAIASGPSAQVGARAVEPRAVGMALYGPYAIGVELASTLLLAALIGARHLSQRQRERGFGDLAAAADEVAPAAGRPGSQLVPAGARASESSPAPAAASEESPAPPRTTRFWRKDDD